MPNVKSIKFAEGNDVGLSFSAFSQSQRTVPLNCCRTL